MSLSLSSLIGSLRLFDAIRRRDAQDQICANGEFYSKENNKQRKTHKE